jgi:hypothetical protein
MSAIGNLYGYGYTQTSDPYSSSQNTNPFSAYTAQTSLNEALSTLNDLEGPNPTLGGVDVNSLLSGTGMNVSQLLNQGMDSSNYTSLIGLDSVMNPQNLGISDSTLATTGLGTSGTSTGTSMTPQNMMGACMEMMGMMLQMMTGQGSSGTMNALGDALSNAVGSSGSTGTSPGITSNPLTSPIYSYYNQYDPTTDSL